MYILSQIAGASLAGLALKTLFPDAAKTVYLGTCVLAPGVSIARGVLMEFIISFLLIFTIYGTLVDKRASAGFAGIAVGLVVLFGAMIGGTISGGAMNPARVFGPGSCIRAVHPSLCLVARSDTGRNCSGFCL